MPNTLPNNSSTFAEIFEKLSAKQDLTKAEARGIFDQIMAGKLADVTIGALLGALITKGESVDELVGAAQAMRDRSTKIVCDADCIDTCGTGGDGISTFNVSTTAAMIAAAAGATVAKHGNRSTTRASGSTEVLTELGINIHADTATVEQCLREARIGYLNAQTLHPAMKHAAPVRQAIPIRTIFNLLGPLTNPAGVRRQVLGVPSLRLLDLMAEALLALDTEHAWVVHGDDGLCDLTITGPTNVVEVKHGQCHRFRIEPQQVGLTIAPLDSLLVTSPSQSADVIRSILKGNQGPPRDHALLNSGAALVVSGLAADLATGITLAAEAIDSGAGEKTLELWGQLSGNAT